MTGSRRGTVAWSEADTLDAVPSAQTCGGLRLQRYGATLRDRFARRTSQRVLAKVVTVQPAPPPPRRNHASASFFLGILHYAPFHEDFKRWLPQGDPPSRRSPQILITLLNDLERPKTRRVSCAYFTRSTAQSARVDLLGDISPQ